MMIQNGRGFQMDEVQGGCVQDSAVKIGDRFAVLDAFKFLGIFGVVFIHADSLFAASNVVFYDAMNLVARAIVPVYFMISGYFIEKHLAQGKDPLVVWRGTIWRLCLPFIVWSLVYLVVPADWPGFLVSEHPMVDYVSWMQEVHNNFFQKRIPVALVLSGGKGHLWFLFALMFSVTASVVLRKMLRPSLVLVFAFVVFIVGLLLVPYRETPVGIKINWGTHNGELSLSYIGACVGFLYFELGRAVFRQGDITRYFRVGLLLLIVGLVITLSEGAWLHIAYGIGIRGKFYLLGTIPYGLGLFMLLLCARNMKVAPWLSFCGRYSLGMYALHMLLLDGVMRNMTSSDNYRDSLLIVCGVFGATTAMVLVLGKVRFLRPVLS